MRLVDNRESSGGQFVPEIRFSGDFPRVVFHLHHDDRTQHHLRNHCRHVLRTQRSQGLVQSVVYRHFTAFQNVHSV